MDNLPENRSSRLSRDSRGRWKKGQSGNAGGRGSTESDLRRKLGRGADDAINAVLDAAKNGDLTACKLILERCVPVRRAQMEPVQFMCDTTDFSQAGMSVISAISQGAISPDVGSVILAGIGNALKIKEVDELERRIAQLEMMSSEDE